MAAFDLTTFLETDWVPSFGCTEPAAAGYAAALARSLLGEPPLEVTLRVDPKLYKNGFAVGVPNSGGQLGLRWATALGLAIGEAQRRLEIFDEVSPAQLEEASELVERVDIEIDYSHDLLLLEVEARGATHQARVRIEEEHTQVVAMERDGRPVPLPSVSGGGGGVAALRRRVAAMSIEELVSVSRSADERDRELLLEGIHLNQAIAERGLSHLPPSFLIATAGDLQSQVGRLAAAGVFARMGGEPLPVQTIGGSGNKGITATLPLYLWAQSTGRPREEALQAVALSLLLTSAVTARLGSLSAICGCSNASGIGVACGLVHLQGGGPEAMNLAVNNMVGCVAGMICDGAKLGCALKTFAAVDTAFRSATLALAGVGIPAVEGIVGATAEGSLANLGRLSRRGMIGTDGEILRILAEKDRQPGARTASVPDRGDDR